MAYWSEKGGASLRTAAARYAQRALLAAVPASSIAPSKPDIEMPVYSVAGLDIGAPRARFCALEFHLTLGTQPLHDRLAALSRPLELLPQTVERDPGVLGADTGVRGLKLPPPDLRGDQSGHSLLLVEPGAQGFTDGGVAGGWAPPSGFTPVERAIQTPQEFIGETHTHNLRGIWCSARHASLS